MPITARPDAKQLLTRISNMAADATADLIAADGVMDPDPTKVDAAELPAKQAEAAALRTAYVGSAQAISTAIGSLLSGLQQIDASAAVQPAAMPNATTPGTSTPG